MNRAAFKPYKGVAKKQGLTDAVTLRFLIACLIRKGGQTLAGILERLKNTQRSTKRQTIAHTSQDTTHSPPK